MPYSKRYGTGMLNSPALKSVGKFIIISAIHYGPAGIAGWAVKSVARRPLRILLMLTLEPLLNIVLRGIRAKFIRESDEKTPKRTGITDQSWR